MKLLDCLQGIRQLGFDTAPLIYFVEQHPAYFARMLFVMRYVDRDLIAGIASTMALTEVLVQPLRTNNSSLAKRYEAVLSTSNNFLLEPVTIAIARRAADLRARYNLRTPDALHVATAITVGCGAFLTNDVAIKGVPDINVLVLDELELDEAET